MADAAGQGRPARTGRRPDPTCSAPFASLVSHAAANVGPDPAGAARRHRRLRLAGRRLRPHLKGSHVRIVCSASAEDSEPICPRRRRRPRLRRSAARRRVRAQRIRVGRHRSRSPRRVAAINRGTSYIPDTPSADVEALTSAGRLSATTDFSVVAELDTINICVPTPLRKTKDPDMSYVVSAVQAVADFLHPGMLIVLESTTYPGHDRGSRPADSRAARAQGRRRLLPGVLARAGRSGQQDVQHAQRAEDRRRHDAGPARRWRRRCTARRSRRSFRSARRASPRW